MSFISEIFSSSVGETIKAVAEVGDRLFTSDAERLEFQTKMKEIELNANLKAMELENLYETELTKRWEADSASESWLPRNIRPLSLAYMLVVITILAFFDGNVGKFKIAPAYITLFETLSVVSFTAYFGGRTIQKLKGVK